MFLGPRPCPFPHIGSFHLNDITSRDLDEYYARLLSTPAVKLIGHKGEEKTVSYSVIEKISSLLRAAFSQAVKWGYISANPALSSSPPKAPMKRREVWTPQQAKSAIDSCQNFNLKVCMLLAIGCSMRVGEILGLQWSSVHITDESIKKDCSTLEVKQELKRCDKNTLVILESKKRSNVYFTFPETKQNCRTSLVLKAPKTSTSLRSIYIYPGL